MIEEEGASPSGLLAPFHDALVPGITLMKERSFSTRLGNLHERVAEVIARPIHAEVRTAHDLRGAIPLVTREWIAQRVAQLRSGRLSLISSLSGRTSSVASVRG